MKVSVLFSAVAVVMGNARLRNFRRYQKAAKNAIKARAENVFAQPNLNRMVLNRICNATTCTKCEKFTVTGGKNEFCAILLTLRSCCAHSHIVRGGF